MENKNSFLLTIIAIATLSVAVIGATFAYFASTVDTANSAANLTINTAPMNSAFVAIGSNFSMEVKADKMQEADASATTVAATSTNGTITVKYASSVAGTAMYCTYDLYWDWTGTAYTAHSPVAKGSSTKYSGKEFTIQASFNSNPAVATGQNVLSSNALSTEKDWTEVTTNSNPIKIGSATIWSNQTTETVHTWTYVSKFYNVDAYQNDLAGKTFTGKFYVDGVVC